jgi:3-hydroxyisobutyrate dehydrogenase-like beta-hydroxyacid dehydrogenase
MASRTRKNIGVLGLGIIGQRVVNNLRERGFHVFVWNRTPRPVPNFVGSPAEVAELCDYIQIFVADDDALLAMMQRMTPNLTAHHVVMAHCTVSPDTMRAAAEMAERRGAQLLDCPFTGSKNAAEKGELVYYVGGDEAALRQVRPILEASSKEII